VGARFKRAFEVVTITKTRMDACQVLFTDYSTKQNHYFMRVTGEVVTISPQDFQKHALNYLIFALHYVSTLIAQTGLPHPAPFSKDVAERNRMITPLTSIQIPRYIAKTVRLATMPTIIALQTVAVFWATWHAVYRVNK
jgi:hypothetical protein